ncbi:hypothetical protein ALP05_01482 [Pseudomonas caricapapayae]|uniref:SNF2-related:helicase n=1 Tax=Pseudomonas caricapapayae TaxID=46678 RepID=A0A3M6EYR1_9PSED|nr:DEAD/DEAH box helicase [Pseudomonas caricapapayae]RMV73323.1 hypothetical protein ALP05_01482 [Pseudomonas caricapapayae]
MSSFAIRKPPLLKHVVFDGHDYGLTMQYLEGAGRLLAPVGGSFIRNEQHPFFRAWRIPKSKLHTEPEELFNGLIELGNGKWRESFQSFVEKLDEARAHPRPDAFTWGMKIRLFPVADGGTLSIGDYHPAIVNLYRSLRGVFLPPMKGWRLDSSQEAIMYQLVELLGLDEAQIELSDVEQSLHSDGAVTVASDIVTLKVGGDVPERLGQAEDGANEVYLADVASIEVRQWDDAELSKAISSFELYDYQVAGVRFLLTRSSALLADDMGLGKTRQALAAAVIQARGGRILVITLASLILNIEREIRMIQPEATVASQVDNPACQWVVTNYERLKAFSNIAGTFSVMIIDEAHRLKEPTTECTRYAFDIAAKIPNRYLLTGTPVLNRESELHTLLRLSGHAIGQMPLREFCDEFAGSKEFRVALRGRLSDWMLRRRKDVLPQLKGKHRQPFLVELDDQARSAYQAVLSSDGGPLVRLGKLRRLLEDAKVTRVMECIAQLSPDDKVIVFCEFQDSVAAIAAQCETLGLGSVTLLGSHLPARRQRAADRFQTDPECRVFIGTTKAAGTGINLTAANYVVFCSLPWTPALQAQAEDRAYRNGQLRPVYVLIPLVDSSIDQHLWQMLEGKQALASDLVEPDAAEHAVMSALSANV